MRPAFLVTVFVATSFSVGCGTIINSTASNSPYGGVTIDGYMGTVGLAVGCGFVKPQPELPQSSCLLLAPLAWVDLPFSAVADTVMLPVTIPAAMGERKKKTPVGIPQNAE